jgi:hypothetical protein
VETEADNLYPEWTKKVIAQAFWDYSIVQAKINNNYLLANGKLLQKKAGNDLPVQ